MRTFEITGTVTYRYTVQIEADNKAAARRQMPEYLQNDWEIGLGPDGPDTIDCTPVNFKVSAVDELAPADA